MSGQLSIEKSPLFGTPRAKWAAILVALIAVVIGVLAWHEVRADPGKKPAEILSDAGNLRGQVAATVNGVEISSERVAQARLLSDYIGEPAASALATDDAVIEMMVRQELLYQEAVRRGLKADPALVRQEILSTQKGLLAMLNGPDADPRMKELNSALAGTGFAIEEYGTSPQVYALFERTFLVSALMDQLVSDLPEADRTQAVIQERTDALYRQLRAAADVQIGTQTP